MQGNQLSGEKGCQRIYKSQDVDMYAVLFVEVRFLTFGRIKFQMDNGCACMSPDTAESL